MVLAKLVRQQQTFMSTATLQGSNTSPEPRFWILMQDITKHQHHQIYQLLYKFMMSPLHTFVNGSEITPLMHARKPLF